MFPDFCEEIRQYGRSVGHDLGAAMRPHGHVGDVGALALRLQAARKRKKLSITVIGNSITQSCSNSQDAAWPTRLQTLLGSNRELDFGEIKLTNLAESGSSTPYIYTRLQYVAPDSDIVFVDLSMGDTHSAKEFYEPHVNLAVTLLRSLPSHPVVIYSELFPHDAMVHLFKAEMPDPCSVDIRNFGHWGSLFRLNVPVFSYFDFTCKALRRDKPLRVSKAEMQVRLANLTIQGQAKPFPAGKAGLAALKEQETLLKLWMEDEQSKESHARYFFPEMTGRGIQHPTCDVHEVYAHVLGQFLTQVATPECEPLLGKSDTGATAPPPVASGSSTAGDFDLPWQCMVFPVVSMKGEHGPPLKEVLESRRQRLGFVPGSGESSFPAVVEDSSWVWAEDKKGRPGWIAVPGTAGRIRFRVNATMGWAVLGYLETYTSVGACSCWLGDGPEKRINARISERVSVLSLAVLRTGSASGMMNVTCKADGNKFKIVSLQSR